MTDTFSHLLAADLDKHFGDMVRAKQDRLYGGILRLTRHPEDAADVTQETFVKAYRALASYDPARIRAMSLDGWMWTIALNLCRSRGRTKRPTLVPIEGSEESTRSAEQDAVARLEGDRLVQGLREIPRDQREAIVLYHVVGLSYAEMADATGRPTGTLKAQVARGIKRLSTIVEQEHD